MSTSNQQRASGRRQAFGDLNENTIPSVKSIAAGAAAAAASDPAKAGHSKKKSRSSIPTSLSRSSSKSKKNDRVEHKRSGSSSSASEEDVAHKKLGSPTKKTRVMMDEEEDSKPAATPPTSKTLTAEPQTQDCANQLLSQADTFDATDVAHIFRPRPALSQDSTDYWADEMEDMLELKRANPILDESVELEDVEKTSCPSEQLEKELDDQNDPSGMPLDSPQRLCEHKEDGFKIHIDEA